MTGRTKTEVKAKLADAHADLASPNPGTVPRLMLGKEIRRAGET
jgi:hypothetical protein